MCQIKTHVSRKKSSAALEPPELFHDGMFRVILISVICMCGDACRSCLILCYSQILKSLQGVIYLLFEEGSVETQLYLYFT